MCEKIVFIFTLSFLIQCTLQRSTFCDFKSIFQTPVDSSRYDKFGILERANFDPEDDNSKTKPDDCDGQVPRAIANAQVLVHVQNDKSKPSHGGSQQYPDIHRPSHGGVPYYPGHHHQHPPPYQYFPYYPPQLPPPMSPPYNPYYGPVPYPRYPYNYPPYFNPYGSPIESKLVLENPVVVLEDDNDKKTAVLVDDVFEIPCSTIVEVEKPVPEEQPICEEPLVLPLIETEGLVVGGDGPNHGGESTDDGVIVEEEIDCTKNIFEPIEITAENIQLEINPDSTINEETLGVIEEEPDCAEIDQEGTEDTDGPNHGGENTNDGVIEEEPDCTEVDQEGTEDTDGPNHGGENTNDGVIEEEPDCAEVDQEGTKETGDGENKDNEEGETDPIEITGEEEDILLEVNPDGTINEEALGVIEEEPDSAEDLPTPDKVFVYSPSLNTDNDGEVKVITREDIDKATSLSKFVSSEPLITIGTPDKEDPSAVKVATDYLVPKEDIGTFLDNIKNAEKVSDNKKYYFLDGSKLNQAELCSSCSSCGCGGASGPRKKFRYDIDDLTGPTKTEEEPEETIFIRPQPNCAAHIVVPTSPESYEEMYLTSAEPTEQIVPIYYEQENPERIVEYRQPLPQIPCPYSRGTQRPNIVYYDEEQAQPKYYEEIIYPNFRELSIPVAQPRPCRQSYQSYYETSSNYNPPQRYYNYYDEEEIYCPRSTSKSSVNYSRPNGRACKDCAPYVGEMTY